MNNMYLLMHKDIELAECMFDQFGHMTGYFLLGNDEHLPFGSIFNGKIDLAKWWDARSISSSYSEIKSILEKNGFDFASEFLVKNLGLSLTDCYWIKPEVSNISWKDVNLFANDFGKIYLIPENYVAPRGAITNYNPNATLKGTLQKSWIITGGRRQLVKGNSRYLSSESINEVFASLLHERQGYDNYTNYSLVKIKDQKYDYGCVCNCFTSEKLELVSANEIIDAAGANTNEYELYIAQCCKHGLEEGYVRGHLEYQIVTDFIMSNLDRHGNNLGVLRNPDTLEFVALAPIFDTGHAFFAEDYVLKEKTALRNLEPNSRFGTLEYTLLDLVRNKDLVDISKLPAVEELQELYARDSKIEKSRIDSICQSYKNKIEMFESWR